MRTSCKIIEDLLPMYHDGICSEDSAALVEEHLKECQNCNQILASLRGEIELEKNTPADDLKPLEEIQQRITNEKKRSSRKYAVIAAILVVIMIPIVFLGWNQYHQTGIHFSNMNEYRIGNEFMKLLVDGKYEEAYEYIDIEELRFEWAQEWFDEETLSNLEADGLAKFCEYGQKLEEAGGIDNYEYIGITMYSEDTEGNYEYRLMYNVQIEGKMRIFQLVLSQDGVDDFGCEGSFIDDPLAQFSMWAEYLWQDYEGCYYDPDLKEYVYYEDQQ